MLLPRHTAVAGLLLTAALLGRCFFETAANSTTSESHLMPLELSLSELMTNVQMQLSASCSNLLLVGVIE